MKNGDNEQNIMKGSKGFQVKDHEQKSGQT